jgi:hypothetical protein
MQPEHVSLRLRPDPAPEAKRSTLGPFGHLPATLVRNETPDPPSSTAPQGSTSRA